MTRPDGAFYAQVELFLWPVGGLRESVTRLSITLTIHHENSDEGTFLDSGIAPRDILFTQPHLLAKAERMRPVVLSCSPDTGQGTWQPSHDAMQLI